MQNDILEHTWGERLVHHACVNVSPISSTLVNAKAKKKMEQ
jgi:hypothetical protein